MLDLFRVIDQKILTGPWHLVESGRLEELLLLLSERTSQVLYGVEDLLSAFEEAVHGVAAGVLEFDFGRARTLALSLSLARSATHSLI